MGTDFVASLAAMPATLVTAMITSGCVATSCRASSCSRVPLQSAERTSKTILSPG